MDYICFYSATRQQKTVHLVYLIHRKSALLLMTFHPDLPAMLAQLSTNKHVHTKSCFENFMASTKGK